MAGPEFSELSEKVEQICSKGDFVTFVHEFRDAIRDQPCWFYNPTLDDFLESLGAWTENMLDVFYRNKGCPPPEQPTWRTLGEMLLGAAVYE